MLALTLLGLGACGSDEAATDGGTTSPAAASAQLKVGFPVEVNADNGPVAIAASPAAIISLSPSATEMLFAIGAGGQVKAVDDQSNYPADVPTTDLSGFTPNLEAIVGMSPDLLVVSDASPELLDGMDAAKVPVLALGAAVTLDDTYRQIELLGAATGQVGGAEKLVADMKARIAALQAGLPKPTKPLRYYHELDDTLYTVTSKTFVGEVYAMLGLVNIADAADKDGSGYPQLSAEALIAADPDLIFLADTKCCGQNAQTVAARPGWAKLSAVQRKAVIALDDDIASRWGPRVVELMETVAAAVKIHSA
ncbi:MAG: ABC transporter substrate-binding protein [Acidimicrobiales bacterium]